MMFTYDCRNCDREIAAEYPCVLVTCIECQGKMTLIKVNNKKIEKGRLIQ